MASLQFAISYSLLVIRYTLFALIPSVLTHYTTVE
jgi:hypothetical protein